MTVLVDLVASASPRARSARWSWCLTSSWGATRRRRGVDGSPVSEAAVAFAAAEADRFNEPLIAVSAYTPVSAHRHSAIAVTAEYRQNLADLAAQSLALSLAGLRSRYPGLEIVEKVVQGIRRSRSTTLPPRRG